MRQIKDKLNDFAARMDQLEKRIGIFEKMKGSKDWSDEISKLKSDLKDLRNAHSITLEKVLENKEQIKNLFARLEDIIKGYKDGDEN